MDDTYYIKKVDSERAIPWESIKPAEIDCYPWDENGYRPKAEARVCYSETGLHARLMSIEDEIRATFRKMNDPVCRDSCLEFFVMPDPSNDNRYMNFEFNPLGILLLGLGSERQGRILSGEEVLKRFAIMTHIAAESNVSQWSIEFHIPLDYINEIFPGFELKSGKSMKGNFYKCGDKTKQPHYGCWSPITYEKPDFHRPEFFGTLILE